MQTIILMWNPAISSIGYREFKEFFREPVGTDFNWSIWEWEKAHAGDRFFMVRVGEEGLHGKGNGVVMSGYLTSEPYRGLDWSGKGREVYYMDLQPDYLFDTEKVRTLTDDFLTESFPQFDWTGGHSGRMLDADTALALEDCWEKALLYNTDLLQNGRKWQVARDVFRRFPVVELYRAHYQGELYCINAFFNGGWLDVYVCNPPLYREGEELLPLPPMRYPWDGIENYRIEQRSLQEAFKVNDNRAAASVLRRDYSGADGMKRLRKFARKAGCNIQESDLLLD